MRVRKEHYDHNEKKLFIQTIEDVEPILEENAIHRAAGNNGFSKERTFRKIASIPLILVEKWMREDGVNVFKLRGEEGEKYIRRKLAENPKLMTVNALKTDRKHIIR